MKIVFNLVAMFVACYWAGYLLVPAGKTENRLPKYFRLQIGYVYYLLAFYLAYICVKDVFFATLIAAVLPILLFVIRKFKRSKTRDEAINHGSKDYGVRKLILMTVALFCLAGWPYLATGWGNYWHSGNYDIEDGLNGRDAYVDNLIFDTKPFVLEKIIGDTSWTDFANKTNTNSLKSKLSDSYFGWYASDSFRLQYSNLAFWSYLLNERNGMDIAIVHAIFDLLLMALGVSAFAYVFFSLNSSWSVIAGFSAVAASFYLGTFWAGHIGSMMYGAVAPMLATFILACKDKREMRAVAPWWILGAGAMAFTYPQALLLGCSYWIGYRIYNSDLLVLFVAKAKKYFREGIRHKAISISIFVLAFCAVGYMLWHGSEGYRLRQDGQYRAWGLTHDFGITSIFFGLVPNPVALLDRATYLYSTALGIILAFFLTVGGLIYRGPQKRFVRFFTFAWMLGLLFFYVCIRDSYYIYKYLYTHQFVFVIVLCAFCAASKRIWMHILSGCLLAVNVRSDVLAAKDIFEMPHNGRSIEYEQLANVKSDILKTAFIDLPGGFGIAVRQTFKKHKIETELDPRFAKYFIVRKGSDGDITGEQLGESNFSGNSIEIRKSPSSNYLMVRTWFEPEIFPIDPLLGATPFRWVVQGKNDNVGIYVIRPDHSSDTTMPFLRICGQKGPSALEAMTLNISAGDGKKLGELSLDGANCVWLPAKLVKDAVQPLILRSGAIGKRLHPPEDRTLLYRIFSVAWAKQKYDEKALSVLNPGDDKLFEANKSSVKFGNGWWPPETYNGEHFRWASDGAEIVIPAECIGKVRISLELETGPAHGKAPSIFSVSDNLGKTIFTTLMSSVRQNVEFTVSQPGAYRLSTGSQRKQLAADYRILDFRVLKLAVNGC